MSSLRSLAFILASAIRLARALSCPALHCFPGGTKALIKHRNMLTKLPNMPAMNSKSRRSMCSLLRTVYISKAITLGGKGPVWGYGLYLRLV